MGVVFALAMKDLRLLSRDWANAFFTFLFPLLLAMFFGWVFSGMYGDSEGAGKLQVALVNLDGGPASLAFAEDLRADSALEISPAATREAGETMVRKRQVGACVIIPDGFEENAGSIFAGRTLEVEAVVDPTRSAESGLLTGKLNEIAFKQMQRSFSDPAAMRKSFDSARTTLAASPDLSDSQKALFNQMFDSIARTTESFETSEGGDAASGMAGWRPIAVNVHNLEASSQGPKMPTSSYAVSFPQGVVWGLLGCVMAFAVSLVAERSGGTLLRLTTAPITRGAILAGKALACFISCLIVQGLLVLLAVGPFGVPVPDWMLLMLVVLLTSFGFTGLMMLLAGLSRTEGGAQGLGRAVVLILAMIGGGTIPLFLLPRSVQMLTKVSPFTWATISIEGVLWRGFTIQDLLIPGAVLVVFGIGGYVAGVLAMRWSSAA